MNFKREKVYICEECLRVTEKPRTTKCVCGCELSILLRDPETGFDEIVDISHRTMLKFKKKGELDEKNERKI